MTTHGHTRGGARSPEYRTWDALIQRCENPKNNRFHLYGANGVTVCERWRSSFVNFLTDMGPKPRGLTIDRIDNDGNYEPGNCQWSTPKQQARNRRTSAIIEYKGQRRTLVEWSEILGVSYACLQMRLYKGWSVE